MGAHRVADGEQRVVEGDPPRVALPDQAQAFRAAEVLALQVKGSVTY
ncbi:hypothetical protein ACIBI9_53060 [Nonomuraea sp. NPDC050451]